MTELETMERAKMYIDQLANGVNPLDGTILPDDDAVNQVRISRCLFFVSDVLRRVIENGGIKEKKAKKEPFYLSFEERAAFSYSEVPISISEIAKRINELRVNENMKKLNYSAVTGWLIDIGMLQNETLVNGTHRKRPTSAGMDTGITLEERTSDRGPYQVVVYDKKAQEFILNNLDAILDAVSSK